MKSIQFTNWDTVILNGKEIELNRFFSRLEQNIEYPAFGVYYDEEKREITVHYNHKDYNVILSDSARDDLKKGNFDPITKRLIALAHIQKFVDSSNNGDTDTREILDDDAKKLYISKLKNRKFSLRDYFDNFITDLRGSLLDTNERFSDNEIIHEIIWGGGTIVGAIFALALVGLGVGLISFLLVLSGFAIDAVIYAIDFIRSNVKTRIKRLIRTININKIKKHKIRGLQRSLKNSKSLGNEQEKSNNVVSQNENFKYGIPLILNSYAELLEGVDPLKRDGLVQELKEQLMEYLEIVDGNSISDRDLFVGTEDLQDRIVDLNLRILAARRSSSSDSRLREVKIVQDKLDSLTNPVNTGTGVPHIDFELLKSSETSDSSIIGSIQGVNYTASPSSGEVINTQTQSAHR